MAKVAVVLAGSGRADGSEIHESVSVLVHLARLGADYRCFAPDQPQADVINHATGTPMKETRNCLIEAARISRGEITPLRRLDPAEFDAIFFPGGFGAAKNLCTFAKEGQNCSVQPDVERLVKTFQAMGKPIGMCCIAPVIAARVLGTARGGPGCTVTIGDDKAAADAVTGMGSRNAVRQVTEIEVDENVRLATTPAYMYSEASPWEVFQGIGHMVESALGLIKH